MADPSSDPSASELSTPGIFSSDNISLAVPHAGQGARPPALKHMYVVTSRLSRSHSLADMLISVKVVTHLPEPNTAPPKRKHRTATRQSTTCSLSPSHCSQLTSPQETLNAHSEYSNSEDDGTAQHRINQYVIEQEIGRGSFGSVHFARDQFGNEYVRIP